MQPNQRNESRNAQNVLAFVKVASADLPFTPKLRWEAFTPYVLISNVNAERIAEAFLACDVEIVCEVTAIPGLRRIKPMEVN